MDHLSGADQSVYSTETPEPWMLCNLEHVVEESYGKSGSFNSLWHWQALIRGAHTDPVQTKFCHRYIDIGG